ncbi:MULTISPECIES: hypothetical protein [Kitasatospora]|uniref:Uncharacterized protein n=1 Tax=Kitasatospora cystarginea TaxID=58350 RepID=A0ABN3ET89_9ACTN
MGTGGWPGGLGKLVGTAAQLGEVGKQAVLRGGRTVAGGTVAGGQWVHGALTSLAPPQVPATEPWKLSLGALVGRHPRTPAVVHKLLGLLDGFGAVHLGPERVGFDGEEIEWGKVVEIRTRSAFEVMTTSALEHEVDRIREFLPPVPGRKWVVTRAAEAVATVVLAALEQGAVEQRLDALTVPSEIVHRGLLGRTRTLDGGLFATAGLVLVGQAGESLIATAGQHGIPVRPAERPDDRIAHVETLRERTDTVARLLRRLQEESPEPAEPPGAGVPGGTESGHAGLDGAGAGNLMSLDKALSDKAGSDEAAGPGPAASPYRWLS